MRGGSRFAAVSGACCGAAASLLLAGCHPLPQLGTTHNPPAKVYTVTARVTTVVIKGGSGSIDVTGGSRGTIGVSEAALYGKTPPAVTHVISGTTLTLSYTCPSEFVCGVSYDVQVPRGVAVRVSTAAGPITLTSQPGRTGQRADQRRADHGDQPQLTDRHAEVERGRHRRRSRRRRRPCTRRPTSVRSRWPCPAPRRTRSTRTPTSARAPSPCPRTRPRRTYLRQLRPSASITISPS